MQNLKLPQKIILANIAASFLITIIIGFSSGGMMGHAGEFALGFGIVCLGTGLINLMMGIIMLATDYKDWRNGFLLSAAILLLLSGISCGGGAAFA